MAEEFRNLKQSITCDTHAKAFASSFVADLKHGGLIGQILINECCSYLKRFTRILSSIVVACSAAEDRVKQCTLIKITASKISIVLSLGLYARKAQGNSRENSRHA